ncbi:MAG TPA: serine/threonine-protein kinase [Kofleriaceae bacterium]|nr:serine/threonine-protein kinase [Kofleriaceae bacterium]
MSLTSPRVKKLELERGDTLGKYEILRKIAVGGMAEIYLARVTGTAGFEKLVVIKRILPHIAQDPVFRQMFLDEARLAATLQHPNIADVYDVGEHDGDVFFAMEYVHGQDVRTIRMTTRKRNEHIPLAISLGIIHGTASALDYAHERRGPDGELLGLVHRDVSSSNVMLSYDGAIKLLDFGIARATVNQHKTQTSTLKGKIPYMSPEQCRGQLLDRRSDLFSLGVLMYELTVGRRPFRGDSDFDIMNQIVHHGAAPPSSVVAGYPGELEAIVMKLLEPKPSLRYQTAEAFLHDLEPFLAQHRLWVSTKPLGKYMRHVFADRIAAWEDAEEHGVSLAQHVAETMTIQSGLSELLTPPSAFRGLAPLSQEMPAVASISDVVPVQQPPPSQRYVLPQSGMYPPAPEPERGHGRRIAFSIAGFLLGIGGIVGYYAWAATSKSSAASATHETQPAPAAATPALTPSPSPTTVPREPAKPPVQEATVREPTIKEPVQEPTIKQPTVEPTIKQPPVKQPVKQPPVKQPPIKKKPPPNKDKPPEDSEWDPNSPFLPPS